jgi:hypothetical protein
MKALDMMGKRFGRLVVVEKCAERNASGEIQWRCDCDCGGSLITPGSALKIGRTVGCGCVMRQRIYESHRVDVSGQRFGRLVAISECKERLRGHIVWRCKCDCGVEVAIQATLLVSGHTKSCGCLSRDAACERMTVHGDFAACSDRHNERNIWVGMLGRCLDKNNYAYSNYGSRGITVCESWLNFDNFYRDMGPRPSLKHSIDRINNDGNYEPSNCRWATQKQQANNTRFNRMLTYKGRTQSLALWCDELGISHQMVRSRLSRGWTVDKAFNVPSGTRLAKTR